MSTWGFLPLSLDRNRRVGLRPRAGKRNCACRTCQPRIVGTDGRGRGRLFHCRSRLCLGDRGFNATLRDYGRFALLHLGQGEIDGRRVVPSAWIEEISSGKSWPLGDDYETLRRGAYHNQFWIEDTTRQAYMARGVFGQLIYIDPSADFAAVVLSSWPEFLSADRSRATLAAVHGIRSALAT